MARSIPAVLAVLLAMTAFAPAQSERNLRFLGTWTRHADGCKVKLDVKPETLRCTITIEEGYAISVEADYVVSKDGVLLGILHGPRNGKAAKGDKDDDPLAHRLFYFRVSADEKSLVIDNLNYDSSGDDKVKEVLEGKYHKAEGKGHKAVSTCTPLMPTEHYLQHPPNYNPPAAPVSPMKTKKTTYSDDPNRRIEKLLKQSEDLPNIEQEWERIYIFDQPSHLTPERVHGGIQ
jgi:hypothetical protein